MITISEYVKEDDFLNIVCLNGLLKYNMDKTKGKLKEPDLEITRVARNEDGEIIAGITGCTYLSSLEVEVLWVHESYRGQHIAKKLIKNIEDKARSIGCEIAHLTTYSFQAPTFYQANGYVICGEIDGFPDDIKLYMLKKQL